MNPELTTIATATQAAYAPAPAATDFERLLSKDFSMREMMLDDNMDKLLRVAQIMADGKHTVPKHLQGSVADCMAVATQAAQWRMNPFACAQKTHLVNGTLGYEAQLVNAVIQNSGAIVGRFHYEFTGSGANISCRVGAVLRGETEVTFGEWLSAASVQVKNSPLWKTNPAQQLGYLQVKNWGRLYAPGAILGVYTPDELDAVSVDPLPDVPATPRGPQRKSASNPPAPAPAAAPIEQQADVKPTDAPEPGPKGDEPAAPPPPAGAIGIGQVKYLRGKMQAAGVTEESIVLRYELPSLEHMNAQQFDEIKSELLGMT